VTKYFVIAWVLVALYGCGPAAKLRRAEKLIKQAELQGGVWSSDTVWREVPVITRETRVDTAFVSLPGDTVTIIKDALQVKYVRLRGDTVFIDAKCESDTVLIRTPVNVYRTIEARGWLRWWHLVIVGIAGVIAGRLLRLFI